MLNAVTSARNLRRTDTSREKKIATLVNNGQRAYGRDAVISSVVRTWSHSNNVLPSRLERFDRLEQILEKAPAGTLQDDLLAAVGDISLKDVEVAFENLIEAARKREEGVVYTPDYIIDYLIARCVKEKQSYRSLPRLFDPACGGGGFLIRAAPVLAKTYGVSLEQVIEENLYGMDVNEEAVACAKVSLDLFCAEHKIKAKRKRTNLLVGDSLLTPIDKMCKMFGVPAGGFDLITTNPPYVKLQNLQSEYRTLLTKRYPEFVHGSYSLATLFLVAGHRMLTERGILGFITQNNLFTSLAAEAVRDYLQQNKCLHSIVNFEHYKVFSNASAYTCLIFLDSELQETFGYAACSNPKAELAELQDRSFHQIEIGSLRKKKWRLMAPHHLRNIDRLESNGTPLGVLADIRVGFATLKDAVFLLDGLDGQLEIEEGITVPAIKIAEYSTEAQLLDNSRRIIRPYRRAGKRWVAMAPDEMRSEFPMAYAYLHRHRLALTERDKGKALLTNFYEWGRSQGMEAPGPKLLTKTFSKGPNFLLDKTDSLFCNGYSVKPKVSNDMFSLDLGIDFLQRLLNSNVMNYYARLTSFQIGGGYQCFQKNFIEHFSIPAISQSDRCRIASADRVMRERLIAEIFGISYAHITEIVPHPQV